MKLLRVMAFAGACAASLFSVATSAQDEPSAELQLWRLDCGVIQMNDASPLSDTGHFDGEARRMEVSCYLIRHGSDYLLFDAGLETSLLGRELNDRPQSYTLASSLVDQLSVIGLEPDDIGSVAVSHYHFDHAGQLASFPDAKLIIGAADWTALQQPKPPLGAEPPLFDHWLKGDGEVQMIDGDLDVFGDGTVRMLSMPGHSPGSYALLVKLAEKGPVLLSGDIVHLQEQWEHSNIPVWNADRADSLASMDRMQKTAENFGAQIIVGHDPNDLDRLASFPAASD